MIYSEWRHTMESINLFAIQSYKEIKTGRTDYLIDIKIAET